MKRLVLAPQRKRTHSLQVCKRSLHHMSEEKLQATQLQHGSPFRKVQLDQHNH